MRACSIWKCHRLATRQSLEEADGTGRLIWMVWCEKHAPVYATKLEPKGNQS